MSVLHSFGIAAVDEEVLAQLRVKHPERQGAVPADLGQWAGAATSVTVSLTETFRTLRLRAGTRQGGPRNEYLRALVGTFDDALADRTMGLYDEFATVAARGEYPSWFYAAWNVASLVPLIKARPPRGISPDVRPIAVGASDLRAIMAALTDAATPAAAEALLPQQLAVGVSGGTQILVFGMRLLLELHGDFVIVKLDFKNGYNAIARALLLLRMAQQPRLAHLVPLLHALLAHGSDLLIADERLFPDQERADSSDGGPQGLPPMSMAFCIAIQPELAALDAELRPYGGCARGCMDDVYAAAPAHVVFPAVLRFAYRLWERWRAWSCRW